MTQREIELEPKAPPLSADSLEKAWFDAPASRRARSNPPPPRGETLERPAQLGEFLGDPVADAWLR